MLKKQNVTYLAWLRSLGIFLFCFIYLIKSVNCSLHAHNVSLPWHYRTHWHGLPLTQRVRWHWSTSREAFKTTTEKSRCWKQLLWVGCLHMIAHKGRCQVLAIISSITMVSYYSTDIYAIIIVLCSINSYLLHTCHDMIYSQRTHTPQHTYALQD